MINDYLYEKRFSLRGNKRILRKIYTTTREKCEEKLKGADSG